MEKTIEIEDEIIMEKGKIYDVAFSTGKYEIEYVDNVKCIKITPKSYRVERPDETTRLIKKGYILELKDIKKNIKYKIKAL